MVLQFFFGLQYESTIEFSWKEKDRIKGRVAAEKEL